MPAVSPSGYTLPLFIPDSDWRAPKEPPNLSGAKRLGLDTETKDPGLLTFGPGIRHGKANCVGISLATDDQAWYFPTEHPDGNCTWDVYSWLKDTLKADRDYVGANLPYDIEILDHYGITVGGRWLDIQVAEPLLDEERAGGYKLDVLAKHYLGVGKDEALLLDAAAAFGVDPKGGLWQLPAKFVGPYAEMDALRSLQVFDKQYPLLEAEDLVRVFDMETALMPIIYAMRKQGVRIDLEKTELLNQEWKAREDGYMADIRASVGGMKVDIWSGKQLAQYCDRRGIVYPRTEKGNPSFSNEWLAASPDEALSLMADARKVSKMRRDFIEGSLLKYQINGRLHANFHQMRSDDDGTRSGRLSSSQPNLQQIPARDKYYGPAMRGLFLPDDGLWFSGDFRSQEPRLLVHFAHLLKSPGAAEMVERYRVDPLLDMHQLCADLCATPKRQAKTIGLGLCIAEGQRVLTDKGLVPIEDVKLEHKVWDGVDWVQHEGLVCKGVKEWMTYGGLCATPEHEVWTHERGKISLREAASSGYTLVRSGDEATAIVLVDASPGLPDSPTGRPLSEDRGGVHSLLPTENLLRGQSARRKVEEVLLYARAKVLRLTGSTVGEAVRRYGSALQDRYTQVLAELSGQRGTCAVSVAGAFRAMGAGDLPVGLLQRHGFRQGEQRRGLLSWEPSIDHTPKKQPEQEEHGVFARWWHAASSGRLAKPVLPITDSETRETGLHGRADRCAGEEHSPLGDKGRGEATGATGRTRVYDLLNAGPRHRFTCSNVLVSNCYGMGVPKLAESLGLPLQEAEVLLDKYNAMMPFVLPTANKAKAVAEKRGYVRTLMGRRSRFKHYSGSTRRQYTHKALNRILQGSGADMIKMAMIVVYRELGKIPLLSNHDENNYNIVEHSEAKVLAELMENALPIAVPNRIDAGVGKNWSEAHG